MIITRSPLRISLGGGGTDLPSYYERWGGFLIAGAIDRYVYITLQETFLSELCLRYSKLERVASIDQIEHPIFREAFRSVGIERTNLELTSMADIPAGTGLGSSGSFTTALLKALSVFQKRLIQPGDLAAAACEVEINRLREPIGKQDQYIAAFGGLTCFEFLPGGGVKAYPLGVSESTIHDLEDNLLLFFTGFSRSASGILREQDERSKTDDASMLENLHFTKELGYKSRTALEAGKMDDFASLMDEHWQRKKIRSNGMSNSSINEWYDLAMSNGAMGGKLIGAGGGGFLMFYASDKPKLRALFDRIGLKEVRFKFDFEGTKVLNA